MHAGRWRERFVYEFQAGRQPVDPPVLPKQRVQAAPQSAGAGGVTLSPPPPQPSKQAHDAPSAAPPLQTTPWSPSWSAQWPGAPVEPPPAPPARAQPVVGLPVVPLPVELAVLGLHACARPCCPWTSQGVAVQRQAHAPPPSGSSANQHSVACGLMLPAQQPAPPVEPVDAPVDDVAAPEDEAETTALDVPEEAADAAVVWAPVLEAPSRAGGGVPQPIDAPSSPATQIELIGTFRSTTRRALDPGEQRHGGDNQVHEHRRGAGGTAPTTPRTPRTPRRSGDRVRGPRRPIAPFEGTSGVEGESASVAAAALLGHSSAPGLSALPTRTRRRVETVSQTGLRPRPPVEPSTASCGLLTRVDAGPSVLRSAPGLPSVALPIESRSGRGEVSSTTQVAAHAEQAMATLRRGKGRHAPVCEVFRGPGPGSAERQAQSCDREGPR
jgi:hypothetical protein